MHTFRSTGREATLSGDLGMLLGILRAKSGLIFLCVVVATGLGAAYAWMSPKIFAAKAVVQVEQEEQNVVKIDVVRAEDLKAPEILKTYEQNIVSPEVLLRVIRHPDLATDPAFLPEVAEARTENALQTALGKRITAKIRRDSRLIDITVEDRLPALAKRITELLVGEFIEWNSATRREAAYQANKFLHQQAEDLAIRLSKSEQALQEYKEKHGDVSLQGRLPGTPEDLRQIQLRITEARAERVRLEADAAQFSKRTDLSIAEILEFPTIANAPAITEITRRISEKEAAITPLRQRYRKGHPTLAAAEAEIAGLRTSLETAARSAAKLLDVRLNELKVTEDKLREELLRQQRVTLGEDKVAIGFIALTREVEANRGLYESVLRRMKETDITKELAHEVIHIVSNPLLPDLPVKPKKSLILALSMIAGIFGGCFLGFATHAADPSLKSADDVESQLGLRMLGEIPRIRPPGRSSRGALPEASDLAALEAVRGLRTALALVGDDSKQKTVLFTSAVEGEGKTFCALNCAVSFAELGLRTLLIDAGSRTPHGGRIYFDGSGVREKASPSEREGSMPSMPQLRPHDPDMHDAGIRMSHVPNLSFMSTANYAASSAGYIGGETFENFIQHQGSQFDRIVIDGSNVSTMNETLLFARHVQSVCLVIHAGVTPVDTVRRAIHRLVEAGAPVVGFIWNHFKGGASVRPTQVPALPARSDRPLLS